ALFLGSYAPFRVTALILTPLSGEGYRLDVAQTRKAPADIPRLRRAEGRLKKRWMLLNRPNLPLECREQVVEEMLATGFEALAEREKAKSTTAKEQLDLGDAWWDLTAKVSPVEATSPKRRACYWYLKALGTLQGEERAEVARTLQPRIDSVPSRPVFLRVR